MLQSKGYRNILTYLHLGTEDTAAGSSIPMAVKLCVKEIWPCDPADGEMKHATYLNSRQWLHEYHNVNKR